MKKIIFITVIIIFIPFLIVNFYKIDEKTKKQMREELALRRGEATEETVAENAVDALSEASEDFEVSEENDKTEE